MTDDGLRALRDHGPFETEQAASLASRAYEYAKTGRLGVIREENTRVLAEATEATVRSTGIEIGSHDQHTLNWLASSDPQTVNALAGIIHRTYRLGRDDAADEAATALGGEGSR